MKYCLVLILMFLTVCTKSSEGGSVQKTRKAVFVIVDGISADVIEKLNTPHLDAIANVGGYTRAHVGGE